MLLIPQTNDEDKENVLSFIFIIFCYIKLGGEVQTQGTEKIAQGKKIIHWSWDTH